MILRVKRSRKGKTEETVERQAVPGAARGKEGGWAHAEGFQGRAALLGHTTRPGGFHCTFVQAHGAHTAGARGNSNVSGGCLGADKRTMLMQGPRDVSVLSWSVSCKPKAALLKKSINFKKIFKKTTRCRNVKS